MATGTVVCQKTVLYLSSMLYGCNVSESSFFVQALRPEVCNGAKSANKKRKCVGGGTPQKSVGSMVDYFMPMSKRQDLKKSTEATPEPIPEQPTQKEALATGSSVVDFFMPMSKWQDLKKSTDATPEPFSEQPMQKEVPETGSSETPKVIQIFQFKTKV